MAAQLNESASTTIDAPASVVFDILADPRQHQRIDGSGTLQGSISGPERLSKGARFGMDMKQGAPYKVRNTVVEFENDRLIAWKHFAPQRWRYELEPSSDGGTRVTETWDLSGYPFGVRHVVHAIFGGRTRPALVETLKRLKRAAEGDDRA